jgi:uncharacterized protein involved in exopolysaccharide biosynthesis
MDEFEESGRGSALPPFARDPIGVVRRRWPWMLAVLAIGSVAAVAVVVLWPVRYEATAKLLISSQRIPEDFVRSTISEQIDEQLNALVGEVLARDSLIQLIEEHSLDAELGLDLPLTAMIAKVADAITIEPETAVQIYVRNPGSFIFAVRYESASADAAAAVANDLVSRFIAVNLSRRRQQAELTTEFLRREAERVEAALGEQRGRITEFKQLHRGELPGELDTKLARLERLQQQRQSLGLRISDAEGRLLTLQSQQIAADTRATLLAELQERLVRERTVYTDEHPNVLAIQRQIEALEAELATQELGEGHSPRSPAGVLAQRELDELRSQLAQVGHEMAVLDAQVARIPARQEKLSALEQEETILGESYADALRKVTEAELAESLEQAQQGIQVSRLEAATPPGGPKLPRWQLAAGAILAVLGASTAMGVLLELVDPVLLAVDEVESLTGMMTLGEVPRAS